MADKKWKWRVHLRSKPGMWAHYRGHVDVYARDPDDAKRRAVQKLARGTFKDRGYSAWNIGRVEVIG